MTALCHNCDALALTLPARSFLFFFLYELFITYYLRNLEFSVFNLIILRDIILIEIYIISLCIKEY